MLGIQPPAATEKTTVNTDRGIASATSAFPLVRKSPAMNNLFETCLRNAREGRYVAICGHKNDLLEASALFLNLCDKLRLSDKATVGHGRESQDIKTAITLGIQALYIPTGRQIPTGVQHALADNRFIGFELLLIQVSVPRGQNPEACLCPDLVDRCGGLLYWPGWTERREDYQELVQNAAKLLGLRYECEVRFSSDELRSYVERPWKNVGHMIKAMHGDIGRRSSATNHTPRGLTTATNPS